MNSEPHDFTNRAGFIARIIQNIAIFLIQIYQILISPFTGGRAVCRFTPTCSEYAKQAIKQYGIWRGGWIGAKRIGRCRPGGHFGFDPIP